MRVSIAESIHWWDGWWAVFVSLGQVGPELEGNNIHVHAVCWSVVLLFLCLVRALFDWPREWVSSLTGFAFKCLSEVPITRPYNGREARVGAD